LTQPEEKSSDSRIEKRIVRKRALSEKDKAIYQQMNERLEQLRTLGKLP